MSTRNWLSLLLVVAGLAIIFWPTPTLSMYAKYVGRTGSFSWSDNTYIETDEERALDAVAEREAKLLPNPLPLRQQAQPPSYAEVWDADPEKDPKDRYLFMLQIGRCVLGGLLILMAIRVNRKEEEEVERKESLKGFIKERELRRQEEVAERKLERMNSAEGKHSAKLSELNDELHKRKEDIQRKLELDELQSRIDNAEAEVIAARRAKAGTPSPPMTPPVTAHLSEKQIEGLALKAHSRFNRLPSAERARAVAEWQQELALKHGPLVASEVAQRLSEIFAQS